MNKYVYKDLKKLEEEVIKAKDENREAKEFIIQFFEPFIIKMSKTTFINGMTENDIKQSLTLYLLIAIRKYSGKDKFFWYAIQTMKNNIYRELKRRKKDEGLINIEKIPFSNNEYIEDNILKNEEIHTLKKAIQQLSNKDNELLYKIYIEDYDYNNLTKYFNQNYNTIASRKNRALKKLKISMETI